MSNKNSRFYKKVKSISNNVKLKELEEKRKADTERLNSLRKTSSSDGQLSKLDAFGIGIDTVSNNEEDGNIEKGNTLSKIDTDVNGFNALGFKIEPKHDMMNETMDNNTEGNNTLENISSDESSNIELMISSPKESVQKGDVITNQKPHSNNHHNFKRNSSSNRQRYKETDTQNTHRNNNNSNATFAPNKEFGFGISPNVDEHQKNNKKHNTNDKEARVIPGSDVMAQYLAQLQHSTFMYAANILGASAEDGSYYDESNA